MPNATMRRSAPSSSGAAPATAASQQTAPTIPFVIAARNSSRLSFVTPTITLGAASAPQSPIQIPAVGYLKFIDLEVTLAGTGGTSPAFTADAPFNALQSVELRNASGNDLIVPVTGYQLFLIQKYGCQDVDAPYNDPRLNQQFANTAPSGHFFLRVPCEVSPADSFCAIPALASNRSYQLILSFAATATVLSGAPTVTMTVQGVAWFWTEPVATTKSNTTQQTAPPFNGSLSLWQVEPQPVTPGDKYMKSNNVGNVLRCIIFVLRNVSSVREDTDWPAVSELYLDNDPQFYLPVTQWLKIMSEIYGIRTATKDVAGGLDTGVYVIPFFALAEGSAIANARRSQYLPTLDASLLQLRGTSYGAGASTLEIITNSVVPTTPSGGSSSAALYSLS
jgi:hypothetical protein